MVKNGSVDCVYNLTSIISEVVIYNNDLVFRCLDELLAYSLEGIDYQVGTVICADDDRYVDQLFLSLCAKLVTSVEKKKPEK